jgi:GAF domain-containing protein
LKSLKHTDTVERLAADIESVKQIAIVSTMLDVICRTTGMGFAAVARVTEDRWIACSVHDEISFGLLPGSELKVETTICDEIRDSRLPVIIDNVSEDPNFAQHHTPRMYGFQSYISFPIILKTGEFFGTLCAIDPKPAELNNPKVIGMFSLFAELIVFHLQAIDLIELSRSALVEASRQMRSSQNEDAQHLHLPNQRFLDSLEEIKRFSDFLVTATETGDGEQAKRIALKINSSTRELIGMTQDLSDYSA